jgi:hypothetical protein
MKNAKEKIVLMLTTLIIVSSTVFASHDSPPIPIPETVNVKPNTTELLILGAFIPPDNGEYFLIKCDILNPNYNIQYPIVLSMGSLDKNGAKIDTVNITLNGKPLNLGQAALTYSDNTYTAGPVLGWMNLYFQNFDYTDTATVANCSATPVVQPKVKTDA